MTTEEKKDRFFKWVTFLAMGVIIVGGLMIIRRTYDRSCEFKAKNAELAERIERKKQEIKALQTNQLRFKTDADFVEMLARKNRRVFPGELIFIFEDD